MQNKNPNNTADTQMNDLSISPNRLDDAISLGTQSLARTTISRRSFLKLAAKVALALAGASLIEILPVDREILDAEAVAGNCSAWYMCGISADRVCQCATGTNTCPGDTHPGSGSGNAWTGCCNGSRVYYYDCCDGHPPSSCSKSGCQCYRTGGQPYWCGGLNQYCCTIWSISGSC